MSLTDTFDNPQSRVEAILQNAMGAEHEVVPQSRVEELLERLDGYLENIEGRITDQDEEIIAAVNAWLKDNFSGDYAVTDTTLTVSGMAADAKKTGYEFSELKEDLNAISQTVKGINIIPQNFENGYIGVTTGNNDDRTDAVRSADYIPAVGGSNVVMMTNNLLSACYIVEYASNKTYIGYKQIKQNQAVALDNNTAYIMATVRANAITTQNWETYAAAIGAAYSNTYPVAFEEYYEKTEIRMSALPYNVKQTHVITVGSGKDFSTLNDAVASITDSSEYNQYIIQVYAGTYETVVEADIDENYKGLIIPDYVSIVGIGNRESIVIKGTLPSATYADYANTISALNFVANGTIENVVIKSKNLRYNVHDDGSTFGMVDAKHTYNRVKFICEASDTGIAVTNANVGIGSQKNKQIEFLDCTFVNENESRVGILIHDNAAASQTNGARLYVKNCKFTLATGSIDIKLSNSGGTMECYANVSGNDLSYGIEISSASISITTNRWVLFATGNNHYSLTQTTGMSGLDLSAYITAFNNINVA